ncbi:MAG: porin family protein [Novosphingobium lindaniclasticum]|uniref:outer membrane protein n=1 Tax=Novosphingobium lindaniclasticum TaxID=1329895 RepID=UPI002409BB08|nr:porin family protein [Novosphingobium lindaniclasticum]MDF2638680.1 porin family protein [Novosphingobium lindaniclasticum]
MSKRFVIAPALALAAVASPAFAQDSGDFAGPRIAVTGGWDNVQHGGENASGFTYGATAGYDAALGSVRIGPELEFSDSTQKKTFAAGATRYTERADRDLYAGARLGYVVSPSFLLYGKVGYTNAQFTIREDGKHRNDRSGLRAGVGAEYAVTPTVFLTGEYRYSNYSDSYPRNQILGGVGVRF